MKNKIYTNKSLIYIRLGYECKYLSYNSIYIKLSNIKDVLLNAIGL